MLELGIKAPDFELPDQNGEMHKLMRNNSIKKIISRCIMMLTRKYGGI